MAQHPLAGQPAPLSYLTPIPRLIASYYTLTPDPSNPAQAVSFGTSGHRGSSLHHTFNQHHILAIAQAVAEYRASQGQTGPLYMGMDTHALSEPAWATALEVLTANEVTVCIEADCGFTPTPLVSHAILSYNQGRTSGLADGIVITPSHNPPSDGGFKYNPPQGGPADTTITRAIQERANQLLAQGLVGVKRIPLEQALQKAVPFDFATPYVEQLDQMIHLGAIRTSGLRIAVDPLGGASLRVWERIAEQYRLPLEITNPRLDPSFAFMTLDHDGKIRLDCSSPWAMAGLLAHRSRYDLALANDPDADRHGIVTPQGLMNPNHYLAVAINYLFQHRPGWSQQMGIGKTVVSSSIIDRVAQGLNRPLHEVPVGFKYFVAGLLNGSLGFGGEESAGASFQRFDGRVWSTDKDGLIPCLLAAEITASTGRNPWEHYQALETQYGASSYARMDAVANNAQKKVLANLSPEQVTATELAGEPISHKLTRAPGNNEPIGGLKVTTANAWFAARPSGTEEIYKIYAESFRGPQHLEQVMLEAREVVGAAFTAAGL